MKAEEYFNQSRFVSSSFIEITKTGFRSDMPNVFAFAEEYSESQLKAEREKVHKYAEFCIESDRLHMRIITFESWLNLTSNPK